MLNRPFVLTLTLVLAVLLAGCASEPVMDARPAPSSEEEPLRPVENRVFQTPEPTTLAMGLEPRQVEAMLVRWHEGRLRDVKGIYVPSGPASQKEWFDQLVDLVEATELNAMVIDIKEAEGIVLYPSKMPQVVENKATGNYIKDLSATLADLRERGIYTIARIVTFKDSALARAHPEWAVRTSSGGVWRDRTGAAWMNPYKRDVWEYNLAIAKEAARLGFDEIQFDYVRFPSDGNVKDASYPDQDERPKAKVIGEFLQYARRELAPLDVFVSADVFGLVPTVVDDMTIGQYWEELAPAVDYISPMAYPSHYGPGLFGLANPNAAPYETVRNTMEDAQARTGPLDAAIRPWLQDFSLGYPYGPEEVRAQIRAAEEMGARGWLLWNPSARYTREALRPAGTAPAGEASSGEPSAGQT